jgi:two-component system heavy metal sensor histidine kinase CusS
MRIGHAANSTLSGRLIRWLATLSLAVLGCLCIGVFFSIKANLVNLQNLRLEKFTVAVQHLITETQGHRQSGNLEHDLEDLLKANRDLHLKLFDRQGNTHFISKPEMWPAQERSSTLNVERGEQRTEYASAVLSLDISPDNAILDRLAAILWAAALIGSAAITLGGYLIVYFGLAPVRTLAEQTQNLVILSLDKRLGTEAIPAELQLLVDQFNALLDRLEKAYQQLEGFNANVAHELRTPLANIIANSELVLRSNEQEDALRECIASNLEEMHRLSGIVNDMLFLSQADRGAKARRMPVQSLARLSADVIDYYEALFMEAHLEWAIEGDAAGEFDSALLRRALSNLLNNAVRHANKDSLIVIRIAQITNEKIKLAVINQGESIPSADLPHIFDRFFRVDTARSGASQNHGLGLAIVSAIARMHDGEVLAKSENKQTEIGVLLKVR